MRWFVFRTASKTASVQLLDFSTSEAVVADIQSPDAIDVFGEPEKPVGPCMVEAPPSFVAQIEKMIEERL
jgi:hypothetical protein